MNQVFSKYCQMPEASNVYRKFDVDMGSTPSGVACPYLEYLL